MSTKTKKVVQFVITILAVYCALSLLVGFIALIGKFVIGMGVPGTLLIVSIIAVIAYRSRKKNKVQENTDEYENEDYDENQND